MDKLLDVITSLVNLDLGLGPVATVGLIAGLLLGLSILLIIRSRQVWSNRRALGYDVYTAQTTRSRLLRWAVVGVLVVAVVLGVYYWRSLNAPDDEPPAVTAITENGQTVETHLLIPRLAVNTTMIEAPIVGNYWDISRLTDQVAHLAGTSYPGEDGNTVLAGHITIPDAGWGPFQNLETLENGDRVFVEQGAETYVYVVTETRSVGPSDVDIAFPTDDERLTLITCANWDDLVDDYTERFVVIASRLE